MTDLSFTVTFHGAFRVATGAARSGVDATVDPDDPLPGSALKGLMRAAARTLLPPLLPGDDRHDHPWVARVFGSARRESPWNWASADICGRHEVAVRAAIAVAESGSTDRGSLRFSDDMWADEATFTITRTGVVDPAALADHRLLLVCAGQAVHHLGSDRRRGLGWVTVRCDEPVVDAATIDTVLTHLEQLRTLTRPPDE